MSRLRDISQQRFGMLVALGVAGKDSTGKTVWSCRCDCGATSEHTMLNLVKGVAKSCGCLRNKPCSTRLDLTQKRFGKLVALRPHDSLKWECLCDCGAQCVVRTVHLSRGHTRSCGCLARQPDEKLRQRNLRNNARTTWSKEVRLAGIDYCEACLETGNLHAHHIVPFAMSAALAYDVENGVVLCRSCHKTVHKKIAGGATPGQALLEQYEAMHPNTEIKEMAALLLSCRKGGIEDLRKAKHYIEKLIEQELNK